MTATEPKSPSIRFALGCYEAYRRLGFTRDEIFLIVGRDGNNKPMLFASLQAQGHEFNIACGAPPSEAALHKAVEWWNDTTQPHAAKDKLFTDARDRLGAAELAIALHNKGFIMPAGIVFDDAVQA